MNQVKGYVVCLSEARRQLFEANFEAEFAEPVEDFSYQRSSPLVCLITSKNTTQLIAVAIGKKGHRAGTGLRRLNMTEIYRLPRPLDIRRLLEGMPRRSLSAAEKRFLKGGLLTEAAFSFVLKKLLKMIPELRGRLLRFDERRNERIRRLNEKAKRVLAEEKEALLMSLEIAGLDRGQAAGWDYSPQTGPVSFLEGLPSVRLREDEMIIHDLNMVPGFSKIKDYVHGSALFSDGRTDLTVILANRRPLEELLGVDLIYYHEKYKSFIFVQYKAMEKSSSKDYVFRLPDAQMDEEIKRMDIMMQTMSGMQNSSAGHDYRLSENPFFFKFCPRIVFDPDNTSLIKGMYIPLDYWKRLLSGHDLDGPRGGKALSYLNVKRYFDNTKFIALVADAWIGTNSMQSKFLEEIIKKILESGRRVLIAVEREYDGDIQY
ncbi:hypothetical protein [Mailhella massiliensis]|uniref:hypothetical protein n=1 Tax=Mailhella massiliensis TaxID=1903261 RepID=UPI001184F345|nr:hypothetical protein [Mailhella massiliensis]